MGSDEVLRTDSGSSGKRPGFKLFDKNSREKRSSKEYSQTSPPHLNPGRMGRRQLHTIELNPPDYKVPSGRNLIDDYIEKEVRFIAVIPNVPFSIDPTRRTEILRILDNARRQNIADFSAGSSQDAIFSFSAREIKVLKRDSEHVVVREVVHNIAAVSYIKDSSKHLIFVKTANGETRQQEHCKLIVCSCASKDKAEEICSIIQQIFNVVYTELTIKFFEESIKHLTGSTPSTSTPPSRPGRSSEDMSLDFTDGSSTAKFLLKEYIETMKQNLSAGELSQFGQILEEYRSNNDITTFCSKLHRLYGEEREKLMPGIRPYIPERDLGAFDRFLDEHQINTIFWPVSRRSPSETSSSTIGPADAGPYSHSEIDDSHDIDQNLLDHASYVDQLDRSIDS